MPSLSFEELKSFSNMDTSIFVETGTYFGDTTNMVSPHFEKIYTIELQPSYAARARDRFKYYSHVTVLEGDSSNVLKELCPKLDKPVFFWLDGHFSGGDTAQGDKDCPLIEEVSIINELCKQPCVVAIDDVRLFNTNSEQDWLGITRETILTILQSRIKCVNYFPSYLHHEDRMIITLGPK
jgi:hypothetical protein